MDTINSSRRVEPKPNSTMVGVFDQKPFLDANCCNERKLVAITKTYKGSFQFKEKECVEDGK